ncbi:hypothetical protein U8P80_09775 [Rhizobium beringeri]|nr:hypothetical protein U8P80_09775 [Rhizobium beringeri]WSH16069.1 hypothetical protein U8P74_09775 [Rhizobium beringeri]
MLGVVIAIYDQQDEEFGELVVRHVSMLLGVVPVAQKYVAEGLSGKEVDVTLVDSPKEPFYAAAEMRMLGRGNRDAACVRESCLLEFVRSVAGARIYMDTFGRPTLRPLRHGAVKAGFELLRSSNHGEGRHRGGAVGRAPEELRTADRS